MLILGRDGHINRGGEFEQRAIFKKVYTLPAGATKGLGATAASLYVFGDQAAPAMPAGVAYQRLQDADSSALDRVLSTTLFKGKLFVNARFVDNHVIAFSDGTAVTAYKAGTTAGTFAQSIGQKV